MKIVRTWKRNTPDSINGESITITIRYSSFNKDEIDELGNMLPKGVIVMDTEKKVAHREED